MLLNCSIDTNEISHEVILEEMDALLRARAESAKVWIFFVFFSAMPGLAAQAKLEASGDMDLNEFSAPQVE